MFLILVVLICDIFWGNDHILFCIWYKQFDFQPWNAGVLSITQNVSFYTKFIWWKWHFTEELAHLKCEEDMKIEQNYRDMEGDTWKRLFYLHSLTLTKLYRFLIDKMEVWIRATNEYFFIIDIITYFLLLRSYIYYMIIV